MKGAVINRHLFLLLLCGILAMTAAYAQSAQIPDSVRTQIEKAETPDEAVSVVRKALAASPAPGAAQKTQLLALLASLLEQTGQYQEARYQYSLAANGSATVNNAAGRGAVAAPEYLLGAVRCALATGDTATADYVLSTAFFDVDDQEVIAQVKLYAVWSWLCKVNTESEIQQPVSALKSFLNLSSMKSVKPSVLLTLWYITGSEEYAKILQKEFPASTECAVVQGEAQVMPNAFWYFLPATARTEDSRISPAPTAASATPSAPVAQPAKSETETESETAVRWQLGFFRNKDNAQDLVNRLAKAGFSAVISEDRRPSGTTYFTVTVNENKEGSMGQQLKNAGFECYPVY